MNRMNMYNQMYAAGDEVSSGRRPNTTGPNVQRDMPSRVTGGPNKVLTGSGRPPVGTMAKANIAKAVPFKLPLSKMGTLSRGGIGGLIAAGGLGLFEIGRQTGFDPEKLGQAAAQVQKSLEEVANEAVEVAKELGQPIKEFVDRVVQGYQSQMGGGRMMSDMDIQERNEMQQRQLGFAKGGEAFPDLTGDGQVTQADILKGRGVYAEGDEVSRETIEMEAQKAGMPVNEVDQAFSELDSIQPEIERINKFVEMVMEMLEAGAGEEDIIMALKEKGLDEEDIQAVFEAVMEAMEVEQAAQSDPIQAELSQMA